MYKIFSQSSDRVRKSLNKLRLLVCQNAKGILLTLEQGEDVLPAVWMDDRAQVTIEYMLVIALLIAIAALVSLSAANFFEVKKQTMEVNKAMMNNLKMMWEV